MINPSQLARDIQEFTSTKSNFNEINRLNAMSSKCKDLFSSENIKPLSLRELESFVATTYWQNYNKPWPNNGAEFKYVV